MKYEQCFDRTYRERTVTSVIEGLFLEESSKSASASMEQSIGSIDDPVA